jgi:hypothetical protein
VIQITLKMGKLFSVLQFESLSYTRSRAAVRWLIALPKLGFRGPTGLYYSIFGRVASASNLVQSPRAPL